ncbi:MFS transporter [Streptomyces sp. UC4497]
MRGVDVSVGSGTNWAANFAVSLVFPVLLTAGAGVTFALFAGIRVLAFAFTAAFVRETAGRSLETLERAAA